MPLVLQPMKRVSQIDFDNVKLLAQQLNIDELSAQILSNRGFNTKEKCEEFLYSEQIYDPFEILNMDKLVEAVKRIKESSGKIAVFGDFDVDGTTAIAIMTIALNRFGVKNSYYVPSRREEGYGLNEEALNKIYEDCQLVITVDCGIASADLVDKVISQGREIIITDHHTIGERIPKCLVVKPGQPGDTYRNPDLSGAGIAFKIAQALIGEEANDLIDLAAVATVADVVPLVDENRRIVKLGLQKFNSEPRKCFKRLLELSDSKDEVNSRTIGFNIGPRLNAAGRMADADTAIKFLLEEDDEKLNVLGEELCRLNTLRQDTEKEMLEMVEKTITDNDLAKKYKVIVVGSDGLDVGVIGLCAARVCEKYKRPAIVYSSTDGIAKGSGRSVDGIDLYELLNSASDILIQFGGHKMAAGLSVNVSDIEALTQRLDGFIRENYDLKTLYPKITYDSKAKISQVNFDFCKTCQMFQPFGCGNNEVTLRIDNVKSENAKTMGANNKHLKCSLRDETGSATAVAFNYENNNCDYFHPVNCSAIVRPEINVWKNNATVNLKVVDIKEMEVLKPLECIEELTASFYSRLVYPKNNTSGANIVENSQELAYMISEWDDEDISGTVILCDHPTYSNEIVQICKEEFPRFDVSVYLPRDKVNGYNSLVLCPKTEKINFGMYKRIVLFDCLNPGYADYIKSVAPESEIYCLKCNLEMFDAVFDEYKQFSRENMLLAYKAITECVGNFDDRMSAVKEISLRKQIPMPLISVALDTFAELGFITVKEEFSVSVNKNAAKRKLEESQFYSKILLCVNNRNKK